jgi:hypothetical protein
MSWGRTEFGLGARWSVHRLAFRAVGPVLPPLPLSVPVAFAEQAIEVGEISVVVDEVPEAFAVGLARPFAGPWFAARIVRVEPDTPEGLLKAKGRRARIPGEGPACSTPKGEPGGPYGAPKVVSVSGRVATSQRIPLACP